MLDLDSEEFRLYFTYDENRSGGELINPEEDSWSHSDVYIRVNFDKFYREPPSDRFFYSSIEVSEEVFRKEEAYLAVVIYKSGGTFGNVYGVWHVVGAAATQEEADIMLDVAFKSPNGYKPWVGYFEEFMGTEVYKLNIEEP